VFDLIGFAGCYSLLPSLCRGRGILLCHCRTPVPLAFDHLLNTPVFNRTGIVVIHRAIRIGSPYQLGHGIGQKPKPFFTFTPRLIIPPPLNGQSGHPCQHLDDLPLLRRRFTRLLEIGPHRSQNPPIAVSNRLRPCRAQIQSQWEVAQPLPLRIRCQVW